LQGVFCLRGTSDRIALGRFLKAIARHSLTVTSSDVIRAVEANEITIDAATAAAVDATAAGRNGSCLHSSSVDLPQDVCNTDFLFCTNMRLKSCIIIVINCVFFSRANVQQTD